jgi:hypothetical protein
MMMPHHRGTARVSWEFELGVGSILITIGLGLALTLPPVWWPNMPPYFAHAGIIAGVTFLFMDLHWLLPGGFAICQNPSHL